MTTTALIVEDEADANLLLAQLIQLRGVQTESAFTGGEALARAREHPPDLIFLDLMLPDTDGLTVCRRLKTERSTALIPIVVVTARLAHENRLESLGAGAADYVPKPYTPDQIFDALENARSWRAQIDDHPTSGVITLVETAEALPFAQIGRLQAMLLARTPWNEPEVWQLGVDLRRLATSLLAWGRRHHHASAVSSLHFEIRPEGFKLDVQDSAGWSADASSPECQALESLAAPGRFDSVQRDGGSAVMRLVKLFM